MHDRISVTLIFFECGVAAASDGNAIRSVQSVGGLYEDAKQDGRFLLAKSSCHHQTAELDLVAGPDLESSTKPSPVAAMARLNNALKRFGTIGACMSRPGGSGRTAIRTS